MNGKIDWDYLVHDTRARVYMLWAVLTFVGFMATHFYQNKNINGVWATLSLIGLGYMFRVMPLRVKQMQHIFAVWATTIVLGMTVSGLVFYLDSQAAGTLVAHLGAFWLIVMAAGYAWNGLVDPPSTWYWFAATLNFAAGMACFMYQPFTEVQYVVAAFVSAWSMLYLWLLRAS